MKPVDGKGDATMGRRRGRRHRRGWPSGLLIAFGLGLLLALICSPGLVLFVIAVGLIYLGTTNCW